jgi:hypothetical protein
MDETGKMINNEEDRSVPTTCCFCICRCPACGGAVHLLHDWAAAATPDALDLVAGAACGCWMLRLPEDRPAGMQALEAVVTPSCGHRRFLRQGRTHGRELTPRNP